MADFEFFKKEFEFKGKHAKMAQELWVRDDTERTYFKRLIDLYAVSYTHLTLPTNSRV